MMILQEHLDCARPVDHPTRMRTEYTRHATRRLEDGGGRHEKVLQEYAGDNVEVVVPVVDGAVGGVEHSLAVLLACAQTKPPRVDTGCAMTGQTVGRACASVSASQKHNARSA